MQKGKKMTHKHGGDIYSKKAANDFSANINFRGMPGKVREAAIQAVDLSVHYPDPQCRSLRQALAERERENYHCPDILPEHILCGNGAAELLFALTSAYQPTHALIAVPSFYEYEQALQSTACEIERAVCLPEDEFELGDGFRRKAEAFIQKITVLSERADSDPPRGIMILGNPNNPTGRLIQSELLHFLLRLCRESQVLLVLDESFIDFLNAADQALTFPGTCEIPENPYVFVIRSFTKIYAMPGLRFGYCICSNQKLLAEMRERLQPWNVSLVAQSAAEAAAKELLFALESAEAVSLNREEVMQELQKAGYHIFPSSANFLLFCGPEDLDDFCLSRGFLIRNCNNFPGLNQAGNGLGFFRICIRSEKENRELLRVLNERAGFPQFSGEEEFT